MRCLVITEDTLGFYNLPKVRITCDTLSPSLLHSLPPSSHLFFISLSSHLLFIQPLFMESLISSSK